MFGREEISEGGEISKGGEISEGGFEREVILYSSLFSPRPTKPPHIHVHVAAKRGGRGYAV